MGHEGLIVRASRYTKASKTALEPTIRLVTFMSLKLIQFADNSRHLIQFPHSASESCGEKFSFANKYRTEMRRVVHPGGELCFEFALLPERSRVAYLDLEHRHRIVEHLNANGELLAAS